MPKLQLFLTRMLTFQASTELDKAKTALVRGTLRLFLTPTETDKARNLQVPCNRFTVCFIVSF